MVLVQAVSGTQIGSAHEASGPSSVQLNDSGRLLGLT